MLEANNFYNKMEKEATRALEILALIKPPAELIAQGNELKAERGRQDEVPNNVDLALDILHGIYGVVDQDE